MRLCHLKSVCNVFSIGARKKKKTPRVGIGLEVFVVVIIFMSLTVGNFEIFLIKCRKWSRAVLGLF